MRDLETNYKFMLIHSSKFADGNEQVEGSNWTIIEEVKKRAVKSDKSWHYDFPEILWEYKATMRQPPGETMFFMVFGTKAL